MVQMTASFSMKTSQRTRSVSRNAAALSSVPRITSVAGFRTPAIRTCSQRGRTPLVVEANELNKWAGRAMDDSCEPSPFDKETAGVLLRVLTARAVKLLLLQLQELDVFQAQWLNNYAAENPPTTGNAWLVDLFNQQGTVVEDNTTQTSHHIDPQNLAHRVLLIRSNMAKNATLFFPDFVDLENTAVMRKHLERNTFVSGSSQDGYTARRGYIRGPRAN